ncbi:MAG: 30S ribosomal protein S7 [Spirochaetales bacterium]|nr:30S ribosomal protein S7 [Spirochaetales bacterium]MCF7937781.1 30S ribosomal protein S7 [Spirochaetales bacterium]
MSRKKVTGVERKYIDPQYSSPVVGKFVSRLMVNGKKATSIKNVYGAMEQLSKNVKEEPLQAFLKAIENVKPVVEVKSRRVGGSTYQVPVEVRESRREALAMRWIIQAARAKRGKPVSQLLAAELADAFNSTGTAFKKKEDTHRMAEANKAFAHYRW